MSFMLYLITATILYLFWIVFSGFFDAFHLITGAIMSLLLAFFTWDLLFKNRELSIFGRFAEAFRFAHYILWLLYQIVLANIYVAKLVLSPKMPIDPKIIRVPIKLKKDVSMVAFANSITLTPGTITISVEGDSFLVHAIDLKLADDLLSGEMERRVAHVFNEELQPS
jgi:multicomponent Na+:H+ antiporter subunit E